MVNSNNSHSVYDIRTNIFQLLSNKITTLWTVNNCAVIHLRNTANHSNIFILCTFFLFSPLVFFFVKNMFTSFSLSLSLSVRNEKRNRFPDAIAICFDALHWLQLQITHHITSLLTFTEHVYLLHIGFIYFIGSVCGVCAAFNEINYKINFYMHTQRNRETRSHILIDCKWLWIEKSISLQNKVSLKRKHSEISRFFSINFNAVCGS